MKKSIRITLIALVLTGTPALARVSAGLSQLSCAELAELSDGAFNHPDVQRAYGTSRQVLRYASITARLGHQCRAPATHQIRGD